MFFEKVDLLCKKNGTTITPIVKELDMSSSSGTNWKNGKVARADTVKKVAVYFNVSFIALSKE